MRLIFLGSGTSHGVPMIGCDCAVCASDDPRNKRTRPSVLVRADGGDILVDTATDLRMQALRHGLRTIDGLLYTHSHADHLHGIDDLRSFSAITRQPIPTYADARTEAFLAHFEGENRDFAEQLLALARASYRLRDDDNIHLGRIEAQMLAAVNEARRRLAQRAAHRTERLVPEDVIGLLRDPGYVPGEPPPAEEARPSFQVQAKQLVGQPAQ